MRLHYNLVRTTLAADINALATTTTVTFSSALREGVTGALIPTVGGGDTLTIRIDDELMQITAYASGATSATVVRGVEGSQLAAHVAGAAIKHVVASADVVAASLSIHDRMWERGPGAPTNDDEFNDGSVAAAWTQVVPNGTLALAEGADCLSLKFKNQTSEHAVGAFRPLPAGFTFGNFIQVGLRAASVQNYCMAGLGFTNGLAVSSFIVWQFAYWQAAALARLDLRYAAMNASKSVAFDLPCGWQAPVIHMRLIWVAANSFRAEWSLDDVSWTDFGQGNKAITTTPTHMGVAASSWGGSLDSLASYEYFRVG